jgi:hypothetical protein
LLGWIEQSTEVALLKEIHGELVGGNCVLKKNQILEVGGFNPNLGRSNNNLMGGEDGDMHNKLVNRGYAGFYDPGLIIHHWVPAFRMTVAYHLKWAYWSGVSNGLRIIDHPESRERVPHVLGFPRYWIAKGILGLATCVKELLLLQFKKRPEGIMGLMDFNYLRGLMTCRLFQ